MANSKRTTKIIKALNEATITPDEVQQDINDLVTVAKDELDLTDDAEAKDFVSGLVGEAESQGKNPVVQYDSQRSGEEPFMLKGIKWEYVNAIYPDGKKDIGVYRFGHDLVYDYYWFMDNVVNHPVRKHTGTLGEVNQEVMNDMIKQYGSKEAAEKVYYATANKQGRNPENFEMKEMDGEDWERAGREVQYGIDPEAGEDEYEEYRRLKDMLVNGGDEGQIDEDNDPVKLKNDVAKVMAKLDMSSIAPYLDRIDNPVEQAEMIAQFAEKVGVPKQRLQGVIAQLKDTANNQGAEQQIEAKMSKSKLIETVVGKKEKKVIKTVKVKDIK